MAFLVKTALYRHTLQPSCYRLDHNPLPALSPRLPKGTSLSLFYQVPKDDNNTEKVEQMDISAEWQEPSKSSLVGTGRLLGTPSNL